MSKKKGKSLPRKIAEAVIIELCLQNGWDEETGSFVTPEQEKELAKVIKRVIRKHDAGK